MVHQHFTLADNLTVLDNIMVGTESLWKLASGGAWPAASWSSWASASAWRGSDARVGTLSVGEKQRVEILKALYRGARVLILDEPTAVLTPQEVDGLFATLRGFVDEAWPSSSFRTSWTKSWRCRGAWPCCARAGWWPSANRRHHAGRTRRTDGGPQGRHAARRGRGRRRAAAPVIALSQVTVRDRDGATRLDSLDLTVHRHEIVAIAGVAGNGQQALVSVLTGLRQPATARSGWDRAPRPARRRLDRRARRPHPGRSPRRRHDRRQPALGKRHRRRPERPRFARWGMIRARAGRAYAQALARQFDVRAASLDVRTRSLSGGNMQS